MSIPRNNSGEREDNSYNARLEVQKNKAITDFEQVMLPDLVDISMVEGAQNGKAFLSRIREQYRGEAGKITDDFNRLRDNQDSELIAFSESYELESQQIELEAAATRMADILDIMGNRGNINTEREMLRMLDQGLALFDIDATEEEIELTINLGSGVTLSEDDW